MVARIKIKDALATNFYYNENKVAQGVAECLAAENYPSDLKHLTLAARLKALQKTASLKDKIRVNSVHISLNFDPSENPSEERLKEIAAAYMDGIGFGSQPYLVYQHFDAGHPHIHILTVKVNPSGRGIDTHNIAIRKSEPARKALEIQFNLVKAEDMKRRQFALKPAYAQKVQYGKSESRRAIANVLEAILERYKYTSLSELNAILQQYNIMADRGRESSRTFQNHGLLYRILDENGKPVGVPIKASSFYNRPTLAFLQDRFKLNEEGRQPLKRRLTNAIDLYFIRQQKPSVPDLSRAMEKEGIHVVLRQNELGVLYGITYVDHKNRVVFNGSDLGKEYSAKAIQERCKANGNTIEVIQLANHHERNLNQGTIHNEDDHTEKSSSGSLISELMDPQHDSETMPYELTGKKKARKKRRPGGPKI